MNRKILIIIFGILAVLLLIFILFIKKDKKSEEKQILPNTPSITKNYKGQLSFNIKLPEKDFNFPKELPLIETVKKEIPKESIFAIANKLGFLGEPVSANDVIDGQTYFWKNEDLTLFAFPNTGVIRFNSERSKQVIDKQLSENEIVEISEKFFYDNGFTEKGSLKVKEIKYLKEDIKSEIFLESKKENSIIYECIFNPVILDYEINTYWTDQPLIYVRILKDGTVYSAQYTNLAQIQKGTTFYKIMDFAEFQENIQKSTLISVKNAQLTLSDLNINSISQIDVNKINIIYLQDASSSLYLQPVFLIEGTTSIIGYGNNIEVTLYLPAISQK